MIGINAQIRSTSGNAEGVGFAIPIDTARRALDQLVRTGHVSYAYVGVTTQDVTPGLAKKFGFSAPHGALIAKVEPDTPGRARRPPRWDAHRRLQRARRSRSAAT